ncbi:hypothetical protein ACFLSQ_06905, partial [Bacteroidota bacterium]
MKNDFIKLLIWLLFLGSSQIIKAQDEKVEVELKIHKEVKVCGSENEKRFQISVNAGEIKYNDEFYGFTVDLTYNPETLKFRSLLDKNTLAEFFDQKGSNVWEPGWVRVYATTLGTIRAVGDKPLIALEFEYLNDCPGSDSIKLDDIEIIAAEEFVNKLNYSNKKIEFDITIKESENSFVRVKFLNDTIMEYDEDSTAVAVVNLNTNGLERVDSLDFELKFVKSDNFSIEKIEFLNEKMMADTIIENNENYTISYRIRTHLLEDINNDSVFMLKFKRNKEIKISDTVRIDLNIIGINDCTCATRFEGDKIYLISEKDTTPIDVVNEYENNN